MNADEVAKLKGAVDEQQLRVAFMARQMDDMYTTPDRLWYEAWFEEEIDRLDGMLEALHEALDEMSQNVSR